MGVELRLTETRLDLNDSISMGLLAITRCYMQVRYSVWMTVWMLQNIGRVSHRNAATSGWCRRFVSVV